jgi:hypothetical protein
MDLRPYADLNDDERQARRDNFNNLSPEQQLEISDSIFGPGRFTIFDFRRDNRAFGDDFTIFDFHRDNPAVPDENVRIPPPSDDDDDDDDDAVVPDLANVMFGDDLAQDIVTEENEHHALYDELSSNNETESEYSSGSDFDSDDSRDEDSNRYNPLHEDFDIR